MRYINRRFTYFYLVMKPRPIGALFLQVFVQSTDMEQDITNAVNTEMQLYNSSGNWDRCLQRAYNYLAHLWPSWGDLARYK